MHKDISKNLNKRILSLLAASAVTFSQIITVMPMQATAAESDPDTGISDSPEIICGDANGDSIIDAKDFFRSSKNMHAPVMKAVSILSPQTLTSAARWIFVMQR